MNKKEEMKTHVIRCCIEGSLTVKAAAKRLNFTERYVKELKRRYRENGVSSMIHGNCGRQPKKTLDVTLKQKILDIRKDPIFEYVNTLHFKDILEDGYNIKVSYCFLYNLFEKNNIQSSKVHRNAKDIHKRRERKEHFGEMLQVDATPFQFFRDDKEYYALHGFIDDATNTVTGLYMCKNECMQGFLEITRQTLLNYGAPESIYADGSSIFFSNTKTALSIDEQLDGVKESLTQYGEIMDLFGTELIHAHSSQAKGRIERLWGTLQGRLVTEFRMKNITTMEQANKYFPSFLKKFNKKFSIPPKLQSSHFVPLLPNTNLDTILAVKLNRTIDNSSCFSLNNVLFKIKDINVLPKTKVKIIINKRIGIKALYNETLYNVIPILDKNKREVNSTQSVNMIISQFVYFHCLKNERTA